MSKRTKHPPEPTPPQPAPEQPLQASPPAGSSTELRGRPGRRSAEDRQQAVLELLSGKASLDQLARRFGVLPETIEGWRQEALAGISEALKRGGKSPREAELEKENALLKEALTKVTIQNPLMERAIASRPSGPAKSHK